MFGYSLLNNSASSKLGKNQSYVKYELELSVFILIKYVGKVKSSQPSLRETRDKRPSGRYPDRSWCHLHTSVKLFWSQLLSGSLSNGHLFRVSRRLYARPRTFHLALVDVMFICILKHEYFRDILP